MKRTANQAVAPPGGKTVRQEKKTSRYRSDWGLVLILTKDQK
jgi:hypothetical protein